MSNDTGFTIDRLFNVADYVAVITGLMCSQSLGNNSARKYMVGRPATARRAAVNSHSRLCHASKKLFPITADDTHTPNELLFVLVSAVVDHVDAVVNNACIMVPRSSLDVGSDSTAALSKVLWAQRFEEWENVYSINVVAPFFTATAFLPLSLVQSIPKHLGHSGCVINISFVAGLAAGCQVSLSYGLSKAAVVQLTTILAHVVANPGVKVRLNITAPGLFPSETTTEWSYSQQKSHIPASEEFYGNNNKRRPGKDEDIAQALLMFVMISMPTANFSLLIVATY